LWEKISAGEFEVQRRLEQIPAVNHDSAEPFLVLLMNNRRLHQHLSNVSYPDIKQLLAPSEIFLSLTTLRFRLSPVGLSHDRVRKSRRDV